ncbi:MAG: hypothetical protein H8D23_20275 [Candidatus Brocadiales bacterium]|nr:hypothetical protein [Candidatus Brocadiales bacterium]
MKEIKLKLKEESWEHLLTVGTVDRSRVLPEDAMKFWKLKQYLNEQLEMCTSQGVSDVDETEDPAQIDLFNQS